MTNAKTAVFGTFPSACQADGAVAALVSAHFPACSISALLPDGDGSSRLPHQRHGLPAPNVVHDETTWQPSLIERGKRIRITGMPLLAAVGPIISDLAVLGLRTGGFVGALVELGVPEYEAKRYENRVMDGHVLLSVQCDTNDDVVRATEVLTSAGANDLEFANDENWVSPATGQRRSWGF